MIDPHRPESLSHIHNPWHMHPCFLLSSNNLSGNPTIFCKLSLYLLACIFLFSCDLHLIFLIKIITQHKKCEASVK